MIIISNKRSRTPAQAGVQARRNAPNALARMILRDWIPAFAGIRPGMRVGAR